MDEKKYALYNTKRFEKDFSGLDKAVRENAKAKLPDLEANPYRFKALHGRLKGKWSMRVGNYRILYEIHEDAKEVWLLYVEHRGNVYDL
ncbi:TPA: type II toxin-antitoxin system RelE/ParE family toxin [archaeon]|nr:type II toxin-antitoxin system RelE/ParE family toxin [Candidatus Naiadarchaeales archaeon SRR2090153.bin461]